MSLAPDAHVLVLGGTGTIGRAVLRALPLRGFRVSALVRPGSAAGFEAGIRVVEADVSETDAVRSALSSEALSGEPVNAIISCLASRTGAPADAWAIDHAAHVQALEAAKEAGVQQFVYLSAICVQKPLLEFQKAKLAFEAELASSGLIYSIVRPTAFFKSLSGQVARVKDGRPFLAFGSGSDTACKPISDEDLAAYLLDCLGSSEMQNRLLPIGGPGPAITPLDQAKMLSELLGREVKIRRIPVALMSSIGAALSFLGLFSSRLAEKAEFARIAKFYATESMLCLDPKSGAYSPEMTPETGTDRLRDHYEKLLSGERSADLGEHAMF